jgi:hypothetical protein
MSDARQRFGHDRGAENSGMIVAQDRIVFVATHQRVARQR